MQSRVIVDDLQVSGFQKHGEHVFRALQDLIQYRHGFKLLVRQARHHVEALGALHPVAVPLAKDFTVGVVEQRLAVERPLVFGFLVLSTKMEIPMGDLREIRSLRHQHIPRGYAAGDHTLAAGLRRVVASQRGQVRTVNMKIQLGVRGIPPTAGRPIIHPNIANRRNVLAGLALGPSNTDVKANRPIQQLELILVEAFPRQAMYQRETTTVMRLPDSGGDNGPGRPKIKISAGVLQQRPLGVEASPDHAREMRPCVPVDRKNPALILFKIRYPPRGG